jgi:hypothetical protein
MCTEKKELTRRHYTEDMKGRGSGPLVKSSSKENRGMATGRSRGRQGKEAPEKKRKCVLIIG